MSLYVLDTDILTLLQWNHPRVQQRTAQCQPGEIAISIVTVEEQLTGWYTLIRRSKSSDQLADAFEYLRKAVLFVASYPLLPFTKQAVLRYESLKMLKFRVGAKDLQIAAIALDHGATVITRNLSDFGRVPGLSIEDWSA